MDAVPLFVSFYIILYHWEYLMMIYKKHLMKTNDNTASRVEQKMYRLKLINM